MKTAILQRQSTSDQGTFGTFSVDDKQWISGELPDYNNEPMFSRIPPGEYVCQWTFSPKFKRFTYELQNVLDRTHIRIHSASFMGAAKLGWRSDLNGCIAVARRQGMLGKQKILSGSRIATGELESYFDKKPFLLIILNEGADKKLT